MRCSTVVCAALAAVWLSELALAQPVDGGWDAGIGAACPVGLTEQGECHGSFLRHCNTAGGDVVTGRDCAEVGVDVTCGLIDCAQADCLGSGCVAVLDGACDGRDIFCDVDLGHGCNDGHCTPSAACSMDSFTTRCAGNALTYCPTGRTWSSDCSNGGQQPYVCGQGSAGSACLGIQGGACNLGRVPPFECATGFRCNSDGGSGSCLASGDGGTAGEDAAVDAGASGGVDAGSGGRDGGTCACRSMAGGQLLLALLLLCGVAWRRR